MCFQSGDKYFLIPVVISLFQTISKTKYSHGKCLCAYKLKRLSHLRPWRIGEDMLYHTSLTVIQDCFIVISKKGRYGLEVLSLEVSSPITYGLALHRLLCLSVCLILRLTKCCPSLGHLGTFHLEEVAESPGSFVAFLVTSTFTS